MWNVKTSYTSVEYIPSGYKVAYLMKRSGKPHISQEATFCPIQDPNEWEWTINYECL